MFCWGEYENKLQKVSLNSQLNDVFNSFYAIRYFKIVFLTPNLRNFFAFLWKNGILIQLTPIRNDDIIWIVMEIRLFYNKVEIKVSLNWLFSDRSIIGFRLLIYRGQLIRSSMITVSWLAIPARNTSAFVVTWLRVLRPAMHMLILKWLIARSTIVLIL